MSFTNIWKILQIEQTRDKKAIKKAYTKLSKIYHPEEKPEEFRQLYEAYQQALRYADSAPKTPPHQPQVLKPPIAKPSAPKIPVQEPPYKEPASPVKEDSRDETERRLTYFFTKKAEEREQAIRLFFQLWGSCIVDGAGEEEQESWSSFMDTGAFRRIQRDPAVLERLLSGIKDMDKRPRFEKKNDQLLLRLWDQYGFEQEKRPPDPEEVKLFEALLPAARRREIIRSRHEMDAELAYMDEKRKRFLKGLAVAAAALVILFYPLGMGFQYTRCKKAALNFLAEKYPQVSFSSLKLKGQEKPEQKGTVFYFRPSADPDITVTVSVSDDLTVWEDYGDQAAGNSARAFGLKCRLARNVMVWDGRMVHDEKELYIFYYPGMEGLEEFCRLFCGYVDSGAFEKLPFIKRLSFCPEDVLFPEFVVGGGEGGLPESRIYETDDLPSKEQLRESLEQSYVTYLYQYEAWNIPPEIEEQYGPEYAALGRRLDDMSYSEDSYYRIPKSSSGMGSGEAFYFPKKLYFITVGNLYQYLNAIGEDVTVCPDKSGFIWRRDNKEILYGRDGQYKRISLEEINERLESRGK